MSSTNAPSPSVNFIITAEEIPVITRELTDKVKRVYDQVASLAPEQCTFESVIIPMGHVEDATSGMLNVVSHMSYFSPEKAIRDASVEAEKFVSNFWIEQGMREDLYKAVQSVAENTNLDSLTSEDRRLLEWIQRDFRRNGLNLSPEKQELLKEKKKHITQLTAEFHKNLNSEKSVIKFTRADLDGLDEDFLSSLKMEKDDDGIERYVLTMKYTDFFPVTKYAKNENTRKAHFTAYDKKCPENVAILDEVVRIRRECAKLMGYESHAAFVLELRMAKTVKAVKDFLDDLRRRLVSTGERELNSLKKLKKEEKESLNLAFDDTFHCWDFPYYNRLMLEKDYQLDHNMVKEYFPLENTIQSMLDIYARVLSVRFVKRSKEEKPPVWHDDVEVFEAWDDSDSKSFAGYIYFDLHPRDGKYSHAACFAFQQSYLTEEGDRVFPIAVMAANFTKPTADKPALLKHDEVVTLFHELGHVMHHILARTKWSRFHGMTVERDFVEAPSQMLENWCFNKTTLQMLSSHYSRPNEPIPEFLVDKIIATKNVNSGLDNLRQLSLGIFDIEMHTSEDPHLDTTALFNDLKKSVSLFEAPENSHRQSSFGHMAGGYDAGYYGYMWSKVFSSDMYYTKFAVDPLNKEIGNSYRRTILENGGTKDGMDLLTAFLGRHPTTDAFLEHDIVI